MARKSRQDVVCESNMYHVTNRGAGRRLIFMDSRDKVEYLRRFSDLAGRCSVGILACCLMDNHVHILFHSELDGISHLMHRLNTGYAQYFNGRHGHVGPVFQQRFDCRPIESREHLLLAVRYIHQNPSDLGEHWEQYPWSSYAEYVVEPRVCDVDVALGECGGAESFRQLHCSDDAVYEIRIDGLRKRMSDAEAQQLAESHLGASFRDAIGLLRGKERDAKLRRLYLLGLSVRQIERLTGIGRSAISRAIAESNAR